MYALTDKTWTMTVSVITTTGDKHEYRPPNRHCADELVKHLFTLRSIKTIEVRFDVVTE